MTYLIINYNRCKESYVDQVVDINKIINDPDI